MHLMPMGSKPGCYIWDQNHETIVISLVRRRLLIYMQYRFILKITNPRDNLFFLYCHHVDPFNLAIEKPYQFFLICSRMHMLM